MLQRVMLGGQKPFGGQERGAKGDDLAWGRPRLMCGVPTYRLFDNGLEAVFAGVEDSVEIRRRKLCVIKRRIDGQLSLSQERLAGRGDLFLADLDDEGTVLRRYEP
jgi:hypothetical protein